MLSLGAMKKIIARCLSDMGGILHELFDFALSHKMWHTGVALVSHTSVWLSGFPEG